MLGYHKLATRIKTEHYDGNSWLYTGFFGYNITAKRVCLFQPQFWSSQVQVIESSLKSRDPNIVLFCGYFKGNTNEEVMISLLMVNHNLLQESPIW